MQRGWELNHNYSSTSNAFNKQTLSTSVFIIGFQHNISLSKATLKLSLYFQSLIPLGHRAPLLMLTSPPTLLLKIVPNLYSTVWVTSAKHIECPAVAGLYWDILHFNEYEWMRDSGSVCQLRKQQDHQGWNSPRKSCCAWLCKNCISSLFKPGGKNMCIYRYWHQQLDKVCRFFCWYPICWYCMFQYRTFLVNTP